MLRRTLLSACLFVSILFLNRPLATSAAGERFFQETGFTLRGRFFQYWQQAGGLAQFGFPISDQFSERDPATGEVHNVQYFERARFEYHPTNTPPHDVLLGRLGNSSLEHRGVNWRTFPQTTGQGAGCRYFAETQHNLCEPFLSYWQARGGLAIFGLPLSEAHPGSENVDGTTRVVQHFERNRFEAFPELAPAFRVQLGLLGSELYATQIQARAGNPVLQQVVDMVNAERQKAGLQPLRVSPVLEGAAQSYSHVQAQQGTINHTGPDGSNAGQRLTRAGYEWQRYGENLAAGQRSAAEVMQAWMNSEGHRANIMNPDFREIGIGFTHLDQDPAQFMDYWTMVLGTPR